MHPIKSARTLSFALVLAGTGWFSTAALAHDMARMNAPAPAGRLVPVTAKDAAWAAKAKAAYPTNVCLVSGDKLGEDMGEPADFIYRQTGKPDRLISFCCRDCVKDFEKDPAKYLKLLDEASGPKGETVAGHGH